MADSDIAGQIAVELILRTEKFQAQLNDAFKKGAAMWAKAFPQGGGAGVPGPLGTKGMSEATAGAAKLDKGLQGVAKSARQVQKDMLAAILAGKALGVENVKIIEMAKSAGKSGPIAYKYSVQQTMAMAAQAQTGGQGPPKLQPLQGPGMTPAAITAWQKGLATGKPNLATPYSGPPPPLLKAPPVTIASMLHGVTNKAIGTGWQWTAALFAGMAALRVAVGLVSYSFRMVTAPARALAREFAHLAEQSRRLYAGALQSGGLPMGFYVRRHMLADVMGVSERDVYQYAMQVEYLNGRLAMASDIIASTTRVLTAAAWEWRVTKLNFMALKSAMASDVAPTMTGLSRILGWVAVAGAGLVKAFHPVKAALVGTAAAAFGPKAALLMKLLNLIGGKEGAPLPAASAQRYATSQFERQGLVLGMGLGANYDAQTAQNTRQTVDLLTRLTEMQSKLLGDGAQYRKPVGASKP